MGSDPRAALGRQHNIRKMAGRHPMSQTLPNDTQDKIYNYMIYLYIDIIIYIYMQYSTRF